MQGLHLSFAVSSQQSVLDLPHSQQDQSIQLHAHPYQHIELHRDDFIILPSNSLGNPPFPFATSEGNGVFQHAGSLPKDWPPDPSQTFYPQIDYSNGRGTFKNDCVSGHISEDGLHFTNAKSSGSLGSVCFHGNSSSIKDAEHLIWWKEGSYVCPPKLQNLGETHHDFTLDLFVNATPLRIISDAKSSQFCQNMALPSIDDYVCAIQELRKAKNLPLAMNIYTHICNYGLESCNYVGNHVVPMFVECGSFRNALGVFYILHSPNEISWTSIILGYIDYGQPQVALNMFQKMQNSSILPRSYTLVTALKACAFLKDLEQGQKIHSQAMENGFEQDSFVGNSLISMYVKCGSIQHAQGVFNKLLVRDVISWTSLISGYAEYGPWQEISVCLDQMQVEGISPSVVTVACSLKACGKLEDLGKGRQIHMDITMKGFDENLYIGNALVAMYGKCGSPAEALVVFTKLPNRDVVSWTAVISGYADHGFWQESLELYDGMQLEGVVGNSVTFTCILKACSGMGSIQKGQMVHKEIILKGYEKDLSISNTLVSMYAKCFAFPDAHKIFDLILDRDVVSWTSLIAGYAEHGLGHEALSCFEDMKFEGIKADAFTFACGLKACASVGDLERGRHMHVNILDEGLATDVAVGNMLVDMYSKCGALSEAREAFDELHHKSIVSWTSLITGYAENGPCLEALRCFEQMQSDGLSPNAAILSSVLRACGSIGAIHKGRSIHTTLSQYEFGKDPLVSNGLISMYANCGSLVQAQEVFDQMEVQDVSTWSTMIKGYGVNHEGEMAVKCFHDMLKQGVSPDAVTFTCLLTACNHSSLVDEGWAFFKIMREDYGIVPIVEHDVCMVSLLAKSGHLYEAEMFLERLCSSSQRTWAALLGACKTYGEEQLAFRCFQRLIQINPNVAAWYVLMAGTYAGASMWDDANKLEELRRHAGILKKPASASIEVNNQVHQFFVGKNQNDEISRLLSTMNSDMKGEGHVPNVDFVLRPFSDKRKESLLCEHAEKLAIAFGLIQTPQGATLRVTKSLRMCNDCHDVSKIISKVEQREIIIRDDCSLHHFIDGSCSCGDMF